MTAKTKAGIAVLLVALILAAVLPLRVLAYIESAANHVETADGGVFSVSNGKFSCRFCHPGEPYPQPAEADPLVNKYRCIACHYDNPNTRDIVEAIAQSNHRSLICRECHDIYHEGHSQYKSVGDIYPGYYGCAGGQCHYVVSEQLYPPANPTNLFAWVVFLNKTAIKGYELQANFFFSAQTITGDRGVFPSSYIDPLDLDPNIPTKDRLYQECLSCHKIAPNALKDDVPDPYMAQHPDKCYYCHSTNLSLNAAGYPMAPHTIAPIGTGPQDPPWGYCGRCHNNVANEVSQSVHASIGCRCHPMLHEAGWNRTAAWLHVYYPEQSNVVVPSVPANFEEWKHVFFYSDVNASIDCIPLGPISYGSTYTYLTPFYSLFNNGCVVTADYEKWLVCFNCHFIAQTPAGVSVYNVNLAGFTWENIKDPHSIKPASSAIQTAETALRGRSQVSSIIVDITALIAVSIIIIIMALMVRAEGRS